MTTQLSNWDAIRLVAGREISTRLRSRAYRITTILMFVAVVVFIGVLKVIGASSGKTIGFSATAAPLAEPVQSVASAVNVRVTTRTVDEATGRTQVRNGELDALVIGTPAQFQVAVKKDVPPELRNVFTVLARQITLNDQIVRAGGDPAAVAAAVNAATFDVQSMEPATEFQTQRLVLGIVAGIFVYLALMVYGQVVAQGVVEEKSSRIVELLLTTIRPWQLMLGKVAGIGLVGLAQLLGVAVAGVAAGLATNTIKFPASIATGAVVWAIVWFLVGFVMYALMFAALGALVSRQEDVAAVTIVPLMLIILPYILGSVILPSDPENRLLAVLSIIPLFAPILMPMRIAIGAVPGWQVAVAMLLSLALIVILVWLAGRVYRNAVLRIGSRVKFFDALRSAG